MNITGYIVDFLKKGNNVEISGIGTLRIKSIAAQYQKETNTFAPAVRTVGFVADTVGDKRVIDYIADKECVPRSTAQKMWDNFVIALKEKLQNEGEHQFEDLGVLKFNPIGEVTFVTNPNINLLENTFGLQELTSVKQYNAEPLRVNPFDYSNSSSERNTVSSEEKIVIVPEKTVITEEESEVTKRLKEIVQQLEKQDEEVRAAEEPVEEVIEETIVAEPNTETTNDEFVEESADIFDEFADDSDENEEKAPLPIIEDIVEEPVVTQPVSEDISEKEELEETQEEFADDDQYEEPKKKKRKILPWIIILCLLIVGAGVYYYLTSVKGISQEEQNSTQTETLVDDIDALEEDNQDDYDNNEDYTSESEYTSVENEVAYVEETPAPIENTTTENDALTDNTVSEGEVTTEEPVVESTESTENTSVVNNYQEQFLLKEVVAENRIRENENLYRANGIFAMSTIDADLMMAYYCANPDKLPIVKPIEAPVKKAPKVEKKPARRKVHIPVKSKSDYEFDLVAGIFRVKSNAMKHADDIAQYGINPYVIEVPKNGTTFYYVSLGGRKTYTEAEALQANYRNLRGVDMAITKW